MRRRLLPYAPQQPSGFTLVELLVVITIIVILLTMTLMTVNFTKEGDRVKGAAKQVQSFLAGARESSCCFHNGVHCSRWGLEFAGQLGEH